MNRKADANMWWIIIGAVIALVVLIVLMVIFVNKSNALEGGLLDCSNKGGTCIAISTQTDKALACKDIGKSYDSLFSCTGEQICCIGTDRSEGESCDVSAGKSCSTGLTCNTATKVCEKK